MADTTFTNATQVLEPFRGIKRVTLEEYFTSGHRALVLTEAGQQFYGATAQVTSVRRRTARTSASSTSPTRTRATAAGSPGSRRS